MEYKCRVPGCKSNYDSVSKDGNQKSVSTFGVPKDEQIRQQWIKNIPRDLPNITKHTRVCMKHFEEKDVYTHNIHTNPDGSTLSYRVSNEIYM